MLANSDHACYCKLEMSKSFADRIVACAGVVVVAAFFLPWLRLGDLAGPTGWEIASDGEFFGVASRALWLVPVCGLVMMASLAFELARPITACAGAAIALVTIWVVARPVTPLEGGLAIAILGSVIVLIGDLSKTRMLRAIGAVCLAGSFLLDWFGRTGYANTQPAPCPHTRVTLIPWGVVIAAAVALASALAPHRATRMLARSACSIAVLTVLSYVVVAYDLLATPMWATTAAGVLVLLVALTARDRD